MDECVTYFAKQLKFRFDERRASSKRMVGGITTRSTANIDDFDSNDAAYEVRTSNFKELSRYILEDVLGCLKGTRLLLCIRKDLDEHFSNMLSDGAKIQRANGVAGDKCKISGQEYFCLSVLIFKDDFYVDLVSGEMQKKKFEYEYFRKQGFSVEIEGTDLKLPFLWSQLIEQSREIMFFGSPFATTRPFDEFFRRKRDIQYLHHVFQGMADEFWGDANASAQLYAAYQRQKAAVLEQQLEKAPKLKEEEIFGALKSMSRCQSVFVQMFDGLCRNEFKLCCTRYNNYGTEIVLEEDLERHIYAAEHIAFPTQWKVLAGMRGINDNDAREKNRTEWKQRQVFFQLLALLRMSNTQLLGWWAMIQSVANFGWGVGATAGDINNYWGITVGSSSRAKWLTELTANPVYHYRKLLRQSPLKVFTYDNFQIGQQLKEQRGKHSSAYFKRALIWFATKVLNSTTHHTIIVVLTLLVTTNNCYPRLQVWLDTRMLPLMISLHRL